MRNAKQLVDKRIHHIMSNLPYKEYIPDSVLHIGVRTGLWLAGWTNTFKYIDLVGIDIVDYLPIERIEGVNKQTFPKLASHKYQFIQGNPIEKKFANTIKTNFDIVVQECHLYTQEEALTIFQNFSGKCNTLYVIQNINSEQLLQYLTKNLNVPHITKHSVVSKKNKQVHEHSITVKY